MERAALGPTPAIARALLTQAIGALAEAVPSESFDLDGVLAELGSARAALAQIERESRAAPQADLAAKIMQQLVAALEILQDARPRVAQARASAGHVADVLAILHPLRKALAGELPSEPARRDPGAAPAPEPEDDLRRTARVDLGTTIGGESGSNFYTGFSENISGGGVFVATYELQPINAKVLVSFILPGGHQIMTHGRVRWVREYDATKPELPPGMGVQFSELKPADRDAIVKYTRRHPPIFYDEEM